MSAPNLATADLCDTHSGPLQVADGIFRDFGGSKAFSGPIRTLKLHEDNSLVRSALESPGAGAVLVIDGGGSTRCALVGDQLAKLAVKNGWSGVIVFGCIRDSDAIRELPIGVKALGTHPLKSVKRGEGQADVPVRFAGVTFTPGNFVHADGDGVVVTETALS